jgi:hypothetical protein
MARRIVEKVRDGGRERRGEERKGRIGQLLVGGRGTGGGGDE